MKASLNRIIIFAGNAVKLASFYQEHFGLKAIGELSAEWAELDAGNCRLAFHQAYGMEGAITTPTGSGMHPHTIVFTVEDVPAMHQLLVDKGVTMQDIYRNEEIGLVLANGQDPEGHVFQLCNR